jgi:hypothetical protein
MGSPVSVGTIALTGIAIAAFLSAICAPLMLRRQRFIPVSEEEKSSGAPRSGPERSAPHLKVYASSAKSGQR